MLAARSWLSLKRDVSVVEAAQRWIVGGIIGVPAVALLSSCRLNAKSAMATVAYGSNVEARRWSYSGNRYCYAVFTFVACVLFCRNS